MMDFTQLPIGTTTPDGEVVECPYCGRPAIEVNPSGMPMYNHGHDEAVVVGSTLQIKDDSCPQTPEDLP